MSHLALLLLAALPPPAIPEDLAASAQAISAAETNIQQRMPNVVQSKPQAVDRVVMDHLRGPVGDARRYRLGMASDSNGYFCFVAFGLRETALGLARIASAIGDSGTSGALASQAETLERDITDRCGGPGGRSARGEWNRIVDSWIPPMMHRTAAGCQAVPMHAITACAPTPEEVYMPTPEEAVLIAVVMAAALNPEVLVALVRHPVARGLTWRKLAEAAAAVPVVP